MAKRLAVAAVVTALAFLPAFLAGCGTGAEQAQDLMTSADRTMMANWKAVGEVSSRADDLNAWLSGALAAGSGIDQGGFDEAAEELHAKVGSIQSGYEEAGADYQRMVDLNTPGGYADYARLKLQEIAASTALLNELDGLLIRTAERMSTTGLESGWIASEVERYRGTYEGLYRTAVDLGQKATAVKERSGFGKQGPLPGTSPVSP